MLSDVLSLLICITSVFLPSIQSQDHYYEPVNHRPVVKIITPKANSGQSWGSEIRYKIRVSDLEDGDSKYQEISGSEVYLRVLYVPDPSKIAADTTNSDQPDPKGLAVIINSNCGNCHSMRSKVIGPSFSEISQKYSDTQAIIKQIAGHVIKGSTGIWGSVTMPSHPELSPNQVREAVSWILKNGSNQDLNYLTGLEGVVRLERPADATTDGVFILTASYTDHGTKQDPKSRLKGTDVIVIRMK